jgi:catechol 2,3-dioxygenase-like lactoylglutathione lyase family enzyme
MKILAFTLSAGLICALPVLAQLTAAKNAPVAMGHHHLNVTDIEAHKKFWVQTLGATYVNFRNIDVIKLPNALIFLRKQDAAPAGTIGTSVNHLGFLVPDLKAVIAKVKAAGFEVVTQREVSGGQAKSDIYYNPAGKANLAFVMAPDQVKVELIEEIGQREPIVNHHIHFAFEDVPAAQAWYAKTFGAVPGKRAQFEAADLPGVNLTFSPSPQPVAGTKGRALDHIGFEVKDLEAFTKKLSEAGVKFDIPYRRVERLGLSVAFFTDPWGTYIELTEGLAEI